MTQAEISPRPTVPAPRRWHLFCRVVDNYGDIGVCWRLAKQLQRQHRREVTLWVDHLATFQAIEPTLDVSLARQELDGVLVRHWADQLPPLDTADIGEVVIEAFGCELPAPYLELMQATRPLWINLEYLSAEEWVAKCHLAPSPQRGLKKFFFFPGFTAGTGGLLWEPGLLQLGHDTAALQHLLQELGVSAPLPAARYTISLFAYENRALGGLLEALCRTPGGVHLLVPQGRVTPGFNDWLGEALPATGRSCRGSLTITALPFMSQRQYDRLLAACDLNFVRGEDSFVRSQLLARPLLWHAYPQQESAHLAKLQAFLALYTEGLAPRAAGLIVQAHRHWNADPDAGPPQWRELLEELPQWQQQAEGWRQRLLQLGDLASNLVIFSTKQV